MRLASHLRLPILVLALASPGCSPKEPGGDGTDTGDPPAGTGSSDGAATTDDPTVAQECTPGDTMSGQGDCLTCVCSAAGQWVCDRCDPTTGPVETTSGSTSASSSESSGTTAGETTTASTTTESTTTEGDTAGTTGGDALPECAALGEGDPYDIDKAVVDGDELVLDVVYGGGCETHDFTLCFAGIVLDTGVVLVDVVHDAHGDACEALISEPRSFDLKPLQAFFTSPGQLSLDGWADLLEYTF